MELEAALRRDPVLVGLRALLDRMRVYATDSQIARFRHETTAMFAAMSAEAAWRFTAVTPPVWEYLAHRQVNSFLPCICLIDVIGGYELPANVYADPSVRRAVTLASTAIILANDLYSAAKEGTTTVRNDNLPSVVAAEEGCSREEALRRSVDIHNSFVRAFRHSERGLQAGACADLKRFLGGVWAWMAGSREWHATSGRYAGGPDH